MSSVLDILSLPTEFVVTVLSIVLVMALAPYCGGQDFGFFKVPQFSETINLRLKWLGPAFFLGILLLLAPVLPNSTEEPPDDSVATLRRTLMDIVRARHGLPLTIATPSGSSRIESGALNGFDLPLPDGIMNKYASEGISSRILASVFISRVEISTELAHAIELLIRKICLADPKAPVAHCKSIDSLRANCGVAGPFTNPHRLEGGRQFFIVSNTGMSICGYEQFQVLLTQLGLSGITVDQKDKVVCRSDETKSDEAVKESCKTVTYDVFRFHNRKIQELLDRLNDELREYVDRQALIFRLRSRRGVLKFLGQLVNLQLHSNTSWLPFVHPLNGNSSVLFRVEVDAADRSCVSVAVLGPFKEKCYSMRTNRAGEGRSKEDHSLRVLTLASDVVGHARLQPK